MRMLLPLFLTFAIVSLPSESPVHANDHSRSDIVTTAAQNGNFNTLVSLLVATGLDDALSGDGSFTVFAPNDAAFAKLSSETLASLRKPENREQLAEILKYHVVSRELSVPKNPPSHPLRSTKTLTGAKIKFQRNGSQLRVNDSNVIARNIRCNNGIIQVIDQVLMPPAKPKTIVDIATEAGTFKTLLAAAQAAGLAEALSGEGPLTVFAPSDEAFAKLPGNTIESLLKPENREQLARILKYHVVSGSVTAARAVQLGSAKTLAGEPVKISIQSGQLTINQSRVTANDLKASNGIIHVIDSVLMPNSRDMEKLSQNTITIRANSAKSVSRDGLKADVVRIFCNGGGSVNLTNLDVGRVETSVTGGGAVSLAGSVQDHEARVAGGGRLLARELETQLTDIRVSGGGYAVVNAVDQLDVTAAAGANVKYVETDAKIKKSINKWAQFARVH